MKYFIDTHDKTKGSFPKEELTEQQFFDNFDALDKAANQFGAFGHAAHVSLKEGKAFCFMSGPDEDAIRKAHAAINFPYNSITEVRRVTGADMRIPQPGRRRSIKRDSAWEDVMNNEIRERYLKLALVVSGTAFLLIYPLCLVWPSGWVWHGGEGSYYLQMMRGVYAVLGIF